MTSVLTMKILGTAGTKLASLGYGYFKNKRVEKVLNELANGGLSLEDVINDEEEIYRFTLFIDSLNKASTQAKADVLKNLYLSFQNEQGELNDDVFYEVFSIIGELSDREIHLLYHLENYHLQNIKNRLREHKFEKYFAQVIKYGSESSDSFYYYVAEKLKIEPELASGLMRRLERTGLIEIQVADANSRFQEYEHTVLYKAIKSRIMFAIENSYVGG